MRNEVQTTKLRQVATVRRLAGKHNICDMQKVGFAHSSGTADLAKQFDPLRLKILIMPP